jgi:hypothetical protein
LKKSTIAIIGGTQELTFKKIGKKHGCNVIHHNGKLRGNGGNAKAFRTLMKKADCVVVCLDACGHITMDIVKELAKGMDKKIDYITGYGATSAVLAGVQLLDDNNSAA